MLTELQYQVLKRISPGAPTTCDGSAYRNRSKLRVLLGDELIARCVGRTVIDFGCGDGREAVELARSGARKVIGVDLREDALERARRYAADAGVASICEFSTHSPAPADIILSVDSFEHFDDVPAILRTMSDLLGTSGEVLASFGSTWYHPLGGHLFSVFPWAHLIFSEKALIRWRSDFKSDAQRAFAKWPAVSISLRSASSNATWPQAPWSWRLSRPSPYGSSGCSITAGRVR